MSAQRLLLLDTASLYFRAFYGVPDTLKAPDGRPVNAVRGLLDFIAHLVTTYRPSHLACCWDNDWRPDWRVELIPSYKAHRVAGGGDTVVAEMATTTPGESAPDALADLSASPRLQKAAAKAANCQQLSAQSAETPG